MFKMTGLKRHLDFSHLWDSRGCLTASKHLIRLFTAMKTMHDFIWSCFKIECVVSSNKTQNRLDCSFPSAAHSTVLLLVTRCPLLSQVKFVSDFFKQRSPPCTQPETVETEHLERKPSPQPPESQHGNHYDYCGTV